MNLHKFTLSFSTIMDLDFCCELQKNSKKRRGRVEEGE